MCNVYQPNSEVKCNPLKPPRHSVLSTLNRSYGTTVTMRCVNRCYQPQYPLSVTCQQSGHWTAHPLPQCVRKYNVPASIPGGHLIKLFLKKL